MSSMNKLKIAVIGATGYRIRYCLSFVKTFKNKNTLSLCFEELRKSINSFVKE